MPLRARLSLALFVAILVPISFVAVRADLTAATIYLNAATQLEREWHFRDALRLYTEAQRAAPDGPERLRAGVGIARTAVRVAEFDLAYFAANALMREHPGDLQVLDAYGEAAWSNGLFEEAATAFRDVLARTPADPTARIGLARVEAAQNRLDSALDNVLAALAVAPDNPDGRGLAAVIYRRMRRLDLALDYLNKYYSLVPPKEIDRRTWTQGEIAFLRSFGRRVPGEIAGDGGDTAVHNIPVHVVKDKLIVNARVNGGETTEFVVDTGAEQTVISERAARRLGITPISRAISAGIGEVGLRGLQTARIDTLQIGSLTLKNVPCLIKTPALEGLPISEAESFSPLAVGLSAIVDYQHKQMILARTLEHEAHAAEVPLWFARLVTVRGLINGSRPASFIVDTGGEVVSIGLDLARGLSPQPEGRRIPLLVFGTSGRDREAFLMPNVSLAFDDIALKSSIVVMNLRAPSVLLGYRVGGTVGHTFLKNYRVTFDLQRSILGLTRLGG